MVHPKLYIIAGPNGAGKTTFAREFLPHYAKCTNFVNADLIAQGLSPFSPRAAALKAGRILLSQIYDLADQRVDFSFETTLAGRTYLPFLRKLKRLDYSIHMFFLWIPSVEFALARIKDRVAQGGHDVPAGDVRRRFGRGMNNFLGSYKPLLDSWFLFDSSTTTPRLIAKQEHGNLVIEDENLFTEISKSRKEGP